MNYISTRGKNELIFSSEAMIKGICDDGGLYVPTEIPKMDIPIKDLTNLSYKDLALFILKKFFTDFNEAELKECIEKAYDDKFDTPSIVPLIEKQGAFFLELFHGPTLAFKDMALSIFPHLLKASIRKQAINNQIVILTATSGDTGKAALEGFANIENIKIVVFYPENGVSEIQKKQMITQEGENTFVVGIEGNFDDAQNGVKQIFNDQNFIDEFYEKGYVFSSANSINIGRLIPQIVYYFYSYISLLKDKKIKKEEKINMVVPTGNFGNILAAYYAKKMGLPINKLICASNENNVLYDFLQNGVYDKRRELKLTSSPSMDILISSNLERLLYEISERDSSLIKELMNKLSKKGIYEIPHNMKLKLKDFYGGFASEQAIQNTIKDIYEASMYVVDTHTAVAYSVYEQYFSSSKDESKTVIVSTASPFKFPGTVCSSLGLNIGSLDDFRLIDELSKASGLEIPAPITALKYKKIIHNNFCKKEQMKQMIINFLNR